MSDSKADTPHQSRDTPHQSREKAEPTSTCTRSAKLPTPGLFFLTSRLHLSPDQPASGSIAWELLRNANYWGPLQTPEAGTGHGWGGGSILCLKKPSG